MSPTEQTETPKAASSNIGTLKASHPTDPTDRSHGHNADGMSSVTSSDRSASSAAELEDDVLFFATNLRDSPSWLTADPSILSAGESVIHSRLEVIAKTLEAHGKLLLRLYASQLQGGQIPKSGAAALEEGEEKAIVGEGVQTNSKRRLWARRLPPLCDVVHVTKTHPSKHRAHSR